MLFPTAFYWWNIWYTYFVENWRHFFAHILFDEKDDVTKAVRGERKIALVIATTEATLSLSTWFRKLKETFCFISGYLACLFGCSTAASQQQMALNFELVVSYQLFSVVLASCKWFKISAPGVGMRHMWQLDGIITKTAHRLFFLFFSKVISML